MVVVARAWWLTRVVAMRALTVFKIDESQSRNVAQNVAWKAGAFGELALD